MKRIKNWLLYPYTNCLIFTILVWILYSSGTMWYRLSVGWYAYSVYLAMMYYVFAYLVSLIIATFKPIAGILKVFFAIVFSIYFLANIFCMKTFNSTITPDVLSIVKETNFYESKEFFQTYIGVKEVLFAVIFGVIIWAIMKFESRVNRSTNVFIRAYIPKFAIIILFLSVLVLCRNNKKLSEEFDHDTHWVFKAEEVIDLRLHKTNPIVCEIDSIHPAQVVILLGESFSKTHSSLYGYEKPTNPCLEILQSDSALVVFENVTSPSTFTTDAFKYILNEYKKDGNVSDSKWYDSTTIIEAMSKAGYYTMWISNQNPKGMFDNLASGYSRLCDKSYFNPSKGDGKYDDYLLTIDTDTATAAHEKCMIIYHFMGQHEMFEKRFPESFKKFSAEDYKSRPENQRQVVADYDNATIFNDYVVGEIINSYKDDEAIIIYFPDHSIDVFDTSDDFSGHARNNAESINHCRQIPFMVYVSPSLDLKAPNIKNNLLLEKDKALCTDNLFDFVLRIAGYAKR